MQAIIFDFDGLMVDSETPDYQAWQAVYQARGCDLPQDLWAGLVGSGPDHKPFDLYELLETQSGQAVDRETIRAERRANYADLIADLTPLPGVLAYIADAQALGLKLGVASSGTCDWVEGQLDRLGLLAHFDAVRCADHVERTKPDPAVFLAAVAALEVEPSQAIALEDSLNGVRAAKSAGLYAVAVPGPLTRHLDFSQADLRLESLADLPLAALLEQAQRPLSS